MMVFFFSELGVVGVRDLGLRTWLHNMDIPRLDFGGGGGLMLHFHKEVYNRVS